MEFPRVGEEIEGYRLESVIARGGMSVVFQAEHLKLGRRVALKVLASDLAEDDVFRERFVRESRVAAGLEHPNIIPIYEAGESGGNLFLAMRYVHGPHLKELVKQVGPLSPRRLIPILGQVGSALDAAHARGLVHRDVKPGNILVDPEVGPGHVDHVYLCDFGLTKQTTSHSGLTRTGQFVGTIDYIAPEQVEGKELDARTDIYSLGCVVFECLTGVVPFEKSTEAAVLWAHVQEPPPLVSDRRPDLPAEIDAVIAKAMSKDPSDRPESCAELLKSARAALGVVDSPLLGGDITTVRPLEVEEQRTVERTKAPESALIGAREAETAPSAEAPPSSPAAPPPETRRPRSDRSQSRVLLAAALALLLGIGGGWLLKSSTGESGSTADAGAMGHGEVSASDHEAIYRVIVYSHIPDSVKASCTSGSIPDSLSTFLQDHEVYATGHCAPMSGQITVDYLLIHSADTMRSAFFSFVTANQIAASAEFVATFSDDYPDLRQAGSAQDCGSALGSTSWAGWTFQGSGGDETRSANDSRKAVGDLAQRGFVACFSNHSKPTIIWTDNETKLLSIASSSNGGALYSWWTESGGPLVNPSDMAEESSMSPSPMT